MDFSMDLFRPSALSGGIDLNLFLSTFAFIFVAELPDKTAFTTLILATRKHPLAVFMGVAAAFAVQSLVAVVFGSALSFLPSGLVRLGSGVLFLVSALILWFRPVESETVEIHRGGNGANFLSSAWSSFAVIFIAEWGDLTQLSTAAFAAKYKSPVTLFIAATLALWAVTALAVLIGHRAKTILHPRVLQRVASIAFAVVALILLIGPLI